MTNIIDATFKHGNNFQIGNFCTIEKDVVVGDNVQIGHNVVLKSGTRIGSNVNMADFACTTGACVIGNNINIRTQAVISKAVILEDCVYIGPGVMTNHTKNVTHLRPKIEGKMSLTRIGYGSIIGSRVEILAGVNMCPNVMIGGSSLVTKDIIKSGIYFGMPVKFYQNMPQEYFLNGSSSEYTFTQEIIDKYIPTLVL